MPSRRAQSLVRTILWVGLFLAIGAVSAWAVLHLIRPTVTVTRAVEGPVVQAFYSTGTVEPQREYPIRSNVAGVLQQVKVDKGDRVKAGDELAVVHEPALQFAYEKAVAELNEKIARADDEQSPVLMEFDRRIDALEGMAEIAGREQLRQTQALEARAGSQADLDRAMDRVRLMTMDLEASRAQRAAKKLELAREVEVARSAVNTAEWNLQQQTLRAPVDGVVLDRPTSRGTRVAVNDTIMRIADVAPANLVMRAAVDEEDIARVTVGQPVRLTLYSFPAQAFAGRVQKIYDQADSDRRTFEVDVVLDSPVERLQPGMTGELAFVLGERTKAVVVPSQAVQSGVVWVASATGELSRREVKVGLGSVERVEIVEGVNPGDRVVISPGSSLAAGRRVRMKEVDPATALGGGAEVNAPGWNKEQGASFKGFR